MREDGTSCLNLLFLPFLILRSSHQNAIGTCLAQQLLLIGKAEVFNDCRELLSMFLSVKVNVLVPNQLDHSLRLSLQGQCNSR